MDNTITPKTKNEETSSDEETTPQRVLKQVIKNKGLNLKVRDDDTLGVFFNFSFVK